MRWCATGRAVCTLCPHRCALEEGQRGRCRARENRGGAVVCANYGRVTALALDPVEKKPLRRFRPGQAVLSVGSYGCNLSCPFCQNAEIAAAGEEVPTRYLSPAELAQQAQALIPRGNLGVAYTYNEPLVGYEYVLDCAKEVRARGMENVLVSNGCISAERFAALLPWIDAANIDLKGFHQAWYGRLGGDLETVKGNIALAVDSPCHLEVTTLIVPGENDGETEMEALSSWLAGLNPDIPLHVSRFYPRHRMADRIPTPTAAVYRLAEVARQRLRYVYTGNC